MMAILQVSEIKVIKLKKKNDCPVKEMAESNGLKGKTSRVTKLPSAHRSHD